MRLKKGLEDQELPTGVKLQLFVEVEGGQPKTIKWYKGNEELHQSESIKIEKGFNKEYKLIIEKTELADSGLYRVVLANETDSIESNCRVTIIENIKAPTFKKGLSDQSIPKVNFLKQLKR